MLPKVHKATGLTKSTNGNAVRSRTHRLRQRQYTDLLLKVVACYVPGAAGQLERRSGLEDRIAILETLLPGEVNGSGKRVQEGTAGELPVLEGWESMVSNGSVHTEGFGIEREEAQISEPGCTASTTGLQAISGAEGDGAKAKEVQACTALTANSETDGGADIGSNATTTCAFCAQQHDIWDDCPCAACGLAHSMLYDCLFSS
ncbi:hypothetical protein Tdes44962_MAKER06094 [Teratosphaeria destructans]|uniref:Uncharacterized protein n=1 Tax=Teratosphaeria destructans TaxID=418781 RepID=A0A9W7SI57_9PEZI|nr:hypothetical protein Tdes44962_MAKER06094 [Teratosphaeria destructans]